MSTNSIFILKPIWDALYEDAKRDREEMEQLKKRLHECNEEYYKKEIEQLKKQVQVLEDYNRQLYLENTTLKSCAHPDPFFIDDAAYAAEASAPPSNHVEEKLVNEVILPVVTTAVEEPSQETKVAQVAQVAQVAEESTKTVKMVGSKTKKEYQREYQREYRKKQKNITMNL